MPVTRILQSRIIFYGSRANLNGKNAISFVLFFKTFCNRTGYLFSYLKS
jgi:hypothetical protein